MVLIKRPRGSEYNYFLRRGHDAAGMVVLAGDGIEENPDHAEN
ncbi:hypothetical protein [Salibacterium halotolerans]|nr:hypothetical protein [Salibacterium halotolerans]